MDDEFREIQLESALLHLYHEWSKLPIPPGRTRRYYANRFRPMFNRSDSRWIGGIPAVKTVLHKWKTGGFSRILEAGREDLTIERFIVLSGSWDDLFDEADRAAARKKLQSQPLENRK